MFENGKLVYEANASAQEFHESKAETKVLWGGMGSGKTSAALIEFVMQASESRVPTRGVVIRENYRQLQDSTLATWLEWFGDAQHYVPKHDKSILPLPGPGGKVLKHELWFRACSRPEDASKFLSTEFSFVFMEECVPAFQHNGSMGAGLAKGVYDIVQLRMRQKGAHRLTVVCTFNPPFKKHWCHKLFLEQTPAELAKKSIFVKKQPPRENEKNLPPDYYDKIIERSDDPDIVRRFVYGEVVEAYDGVRVYPECRDGVHIIDEELEPVKGVPLVLGWDFGRSPATLVTQVTPLGQWRILREMQSLNSGIEKHIEILRVMLNQYYSEFQIRNNWGDPSGEYGTQVNDNTAFKVLTAQGFNIAGGEQKIAARLEAMKQQFTRTLDDGSPKIIVSRPNCQLFAEGLTGAYRFPKSREGMIGEDPIKNEACVDPATEALTPTGWKRHDELKVGDAIMGFDGKRLVPDMVMGMFRSDDAADVLSFKSKSFSMLATPDHRCVIRSKYDATPRIVRARDLNSSQAFLTHASGGADHRLAKFSDEFIRLCAWIATEGTYRADGCTVIGQSRFANPVYCDELAGLVSRFPGCYEAQPQGECRVFRITREIASAVRHWMPEKYPSWAMIERMPPRQARLYLYEAVRGDGSINGALIPPPPEMSRARDFFTVSGAVRLYQAVHRVAWMDSAQVLAVHAGFRTTRKDHGERTMLTIFRPKIGAQVDFCERGSERVDGVWCPTTKTGNWVARRGEGTFITGNSHLQDAAQYIATREFSVTPNVKMAIDPFGRPLPPEITWNPLQRLRPLIRKSWMGR